MVGKQVETARQVQGELVRKCLQQGQIVRITLTTSSMSPVLLPGDELVVESAAWQQLQPGNIILYERSAALFAHRLIRVKRRTPELCLITKGDAAESYDSAVTAEAYVGRVTKVVRRGHVRDFAGPGARIGAWLYVMRLVVKTMMTRLTHNLQERLGIAGVLLLALVLFGTATASAAVSISSFGAVGGQGQITVSWTTATEMRNFGFNLFRSTDQTTWTKVTFVQSQSPCNSSVTGNSYSYTDKSTDLVLTTTYYYRLQLNGVPCKDPDTYYDRIVSASPNGAKGPVLPTPPPTTVPPRATPTSIPPTATPISVPPSATPISVPSTATPTGVAQATDTPAATNTTPANPSPTTKSSGVPRFTPTATLAAGARQPTAVPPAATQTPGSAEQPAAVDSTATPSAGVTDASPVPTELAMVVETVAPSGQNPRPAARPAQLQPTPAPATNGSLFVGVGVLGVLGMGAAGLLLLGLAGVVLWRFYARG